MKFPNLKFPNYLTPWLISYWLQIQRKKYEHTLYRIYYTLSRKNCATADDLFMGQSTDTFLYSFLTLDLKCINRKK